MSDVKNPFLARRILGLIATVIGLILGRYGIDSDNQTIVSILDEVLVCGGLIVSAWGGIKATQPLGFKKK